MSNDAAPAASTANASLPFDLLVGEHVIWSGRPAARSLARRVLRVDWILLYFGASIVLGAYLDRSHGATVVATLRSALPLVAFGGVVVFACHLLAQACSRTSLYVVTDQRCVLRIGIALTGTLSIPWRRVASVALSTAADDTGDIVLVPGTPNRLRFLTLYPHARGWRVSRPEPMLRCVPNATEVGARIRQAVQAANSRTAPIAEAATMVDDRSLVEAAVDR